MSPEPKPQEIESLEMKKYQEDLAKEYGLPSPFQTGLIKRLCTDMVESGMVPAHFNNNPMAVYLAAMRGRELELDPMESIMETFWAMPVKKWNKDTRQNEDRGTVMGMYANKMLDIMHRRGITSKFITETDAKCEILFTPPDVSKHQPYTAIFLFTEAEAAGLVKEYSAWKSWPRAMCRARAISIGWRSMNGVVGKGANLYSKEELEDIQYETVAPAEGDKPEVQAEPAKAGRKPKDKPIDVTAQTVAEPAAPTPTPEPPPIPQQPAPVKEPQKFYVISNAVTLPSLDKVEQAVLDKMQMAAHTTIDLPEAMRTSDQATKATRTVHYVLTFKPEDGKATILHTSKMPDTPKPAAKKEEPKTYRVIAEDNAKTAQNVADLERDASSPHTEQSGAEIMAQAEANKHGIPYVVVTMKDGSYVGVSRWTPPVKATEQPKPAEQPAIPTPEEKVIRERLSSKYKELCALVPATVPLPKRRGVIDSFLMAYLGIDTMKEFARDLVLAEQALMACDRELAMTPTEFVANTTERGKTARVNAGAFVATDEPAKMTNAEITTMAKYYQERGWTGVVTSLAENYRRATKPDTGEFMRMLKSSGIEVLDGENAGAYFDVALSYDKETAKAFAMGVGGKQYTDVLIKIRNKYDGADLKNLSAEKFKVALAAIQAGEPEEEPSLFGGK